MNLGYAETMRVVGAGDQRTRPEADANTFRLQVRSSVSGSAVFSRLPAAQKIAGLTSRFPIGPGVNDTVHQPLIYHE